MNEKVMQFTALIGQQIMDMFDDESSNYIDLDDLGEDATAFIYAMSLCAPAMVYSKLTGDNKNFLEFNHMSNQLCFQFMKEETGKEGEE